MVKIYDEKEKKSDVTEKKIMVVDVNHSVEVQRKLFELGCKWKTGERYPMFTNNRFLYVDDMGYITCSHDNRRFFDNHEYSKIYYEDLIRLTNKTGYSLDLVYDYDGDVDVVIVDDDNGEQVVAGNILTFTKKGEIRLYPRVNKAPAKQAGLKLDSEGRVYLENY